ncbi:Uncharacterized protein At4g26450 [Linum perenne]
MHPRHRSPGNGYRMSFGGSRVPPDGAGRGGHGFYNSEYRGFRNRGFGRGHGQPKSFQQAPRLPPRKEDRMMEAGRLAAEYLVSKGLLPQAALSGKWQNGGLKNMAGDYPDFRQQEGSVQDNRVSAHARLGSGPSDAGSGRYSDEFNSRNQFRGRRRGEHPRSHSNEWVRDSGRSSSGSERNRESPEEEGHDDSSGRYEVQQGSKVADDRMQVSDRNVVGREKVEPADVESRMKKFDALDDLGSKASLSSDVAEKADDEIANTCEDPTESNSENEEKKVLDNDESKKQAVPEELLSKPVVVEDDQSAKNVSDLSVFCNFGKVPTKMRSALTSRVSKVDQVSSNGGISSETELLKGSDDLAQAQDASFNLPVAVGGISEMNDLKDSHAEPSKDVHMQLAEDEKVGPVYGLERGKCTRSHSFPDGAFDIDSEFETNNETGTYVRSSSVKERGEKRPAGDIDLSQQQQKKARESLSTMVPGSNTSTENILIPNEAVSLAQPLIPVTENSLGISRDLPEDITGSDEEYSEQKNRSSGSFKICDLNLMGVTDIHDHQNNEPLPMYPPVVVPKKEAVDVDADSSISKAKMPNEYIRHVSSGKEIEVIDLENDSPPQNEAVDNSQSKMEVAFSGTEGFSNNAQANGEITDVPDDYDGLTISEFLNSFSNCTSVAEAINPLQNEIGLHNAEGTLGYDDSIYTSLEEIPLSMLLVLYQTGSSHHHGSSRSHSDLSSLRKCSSAFTLIAVSIISVWFSKQSFNENLVLVRIMYHEKHIKIQVLSLKVRGFLQPLLLFNYGGCS